jgi:hypothetical protein
MTLAPPTPTPTPPPVAGIKPGVRTTEFALTVLAQIFLTLNTAGVWVYVHPQWVSLVTQGAVLGGYSLSRGWAKSAAGVR